MSSRRHFLAASAAAASGLTFPTLRPSAAAAAAELRRHPGSPQDIATDEDFWAEVARAFTVDRSLINLNNGGVSPAPAWVQDAMKRHLDYSNEAPTYTMWRVLQPQKESVRARLAREWGVDTEEIAITRNASEGLQICQLGFDLQRGDEIVTTSQDYPRMLTTFRQRARREGVVLHEVEIQVPAEDPAAVVAAYERAITPRTRLMLVCHMINLSGQILPVRDVVALGRRRGIPVIVDGAHALAHFAFKLSDLDCDYYATSLHKWLFAPHGTGLLYVRRNRIAGLWPLMAAPTELDDDIRKFEEIGTHPIANFLAIAEALTFHQGIGAARKEARLVYLRDAWANRLLAHERVRLHTSQKPGLAAGIATVEVDGVEPNRLAGWLFAQHRIIVSPITHAQFRGVRISPSVYTTMEELDRFVEAMEVVVREGLPAA
ncbi:MAG: aminotransferase class V-fold PLP-dependent enzyme [Longimicrobiales bacterium]